METEFEDVFERNSTSFERDEFQIPTEQYLAFYTAIICTPIGLIADLIIIYVVARNTRMHTKINLLLLNFAANDAVFLCTNSHLMAAFYSIFQWDFEYIAWIDCTVSALANCCQLTTVVFLLVLLSNSLMKNKRATISTLLIVIYIGDLIHFFTDVSMYYIHEFWYTSHIIGFMLFGFAYLLLLVKECNNCFKKWYRKDPLSERTRFRMNIARIFLYAWCSIVPIHFFAYITGLRGLIMLASHSLMAGAYVLAYVFSADKQFRICLLSLMHGTDAGIYDVDATITFAEESDNNENVNISFDQRAVTDQR